MAAISESGERYHKKTREISIVVFDFRKRRVCLWKDIYGSSFHNTMNIKQWRLPVVEMRRINEVHT